MSAVDTTIGLHPSMATTSLIWAPDSGVLGQRSAGIILATMKVEFYDRYPWSPKSAAKLAVGDWIERVYNRRRRHSGIGMVEFENRRTQTAQTV